MVIYLRQESMNNVQFRTKPIIKPCVKLICKGVSYYLSEVDEDIFFEWIDKIPSIVLCYGIGDELCLFVQEEALSSKDLENILALFRRYYIDTKQLKVFLNDENKAWLGKWVI